MSLMKFKFIKPNNSKSRLTKNGLLFVKNTTFEKYGIKNPKFFELYFDEINKIIAIKFKTKDVENSRKVINSINSSAKYLNLNCFLKYYNFDKFTKSIILAHVFEDNMLKFDFSVLHNERD